jgi:4-deoxy-L-threo-5-hexosulose-uronate ketol-isomerase
MTTEDLRKSFLIDHLFTPDEIPMVYSDIDRSITGSAVPIKGPLKLLGTKKEMAAEYFAERREIGVINTGGDGTIVVDGKEYAMTFKDALYIGRGVRTIEFSGKSADNFQRPTRSSLMQSQHDWGVRKTPTNARSTSISTRTASGAVNWSWA